MVKMNTVISEVIVFSNLTIFICFDNYSHTARFYWFNVWFPNRARRGLENKSYLDEGRMEKLEQMLKQTEQIANEAEAKYEEVMYFIIDRNVVVVHVIQAYCKYM